jgi:kinesin family protein 16B
MESNARVRVIVRVRPLHTREAINNVAEVVRWPASASFPDNSSSSSGGEGVFDKSSTALTTLSILDPASLQAGVRSELLKSWSREFVYDRCIWSNADPSHPLHGTQEDLYQQVGAPVIEWLTTGFNSCVFAFGQTGSGKTYSMMGALGGSPYDYGLIPRICFTLFESLAASAAAAANQGKARGGGSTAPNATTAVDSFVTLSHMEIYKEACRDLLTPPKPKAETLRVREHPHKGIFVAGLTHVRVTNFDEVMSLISIGTKNRTVGATNANAHSSRSHAIVTLTVVQRARVSSSGAGAGAGAGTDKNKPSTTAPPGNAGGIAALPTAEMHQREGRVHLVDLAGSERAAISGAKQARFKEACSINKSLSVLGDVILALSTNSGSSGGSSGSTSSGRQRHIPYRNSTLTLVLKDSLGGNAHAIMVATVSPSAMDYDETLSK